MRDRPGRSAGPRRRSRPGPAAAPPGNRPPARRPAGPGGAGAATRTAAPRPGRFTGRAIVLGVVLLALGLSYVFPVRVYLGQQAEIAQLRSENARQQAHVADLAEQAALWRDDDYIRIQARRRLKFGEPGELLLITLWADDEPADESGGDPAQPPEPPGPWWDTLWTSVRSADGVGDGQDTAAGTPGTGTPGTGTPGTGTPGIGSPEASPEAR